MNKDLVEVVFIIDESGSMSGLEADTIGGFNSTIERQREIEGKCIVSTIFFNNKSRIIHDRADLETIKKMERGDYYPSGSTALIDAVADAIKHIKTVHRYIREEDVPAKTLFIITTDGMENSSRKHTSRQLKEMIEERKKAGWEFIYLAANIDAFATGHDYGFEDNDISDYLNDGAGNAVKYACMNEAITSIRKERKLSPSWKREAEKDVSKRK